MNSKEFENILKSSMETPRRLSPSAGGWSRIKEELPTRILWWQPWLKRLLVMTGIVGVVLWNIHLQHQVNILKKELKVVQKITSNSGVSEKSAIDYQGSQDGVVSEKGILKETNKSQTGITLSTRSLEMSREVLQLKSDFTQVDSGQSFYFNQKNALEKAILDRNEVASPSLLSKPQLSKVVNDEIDSLFFASKVVSPNQEGKDSELFDPFNITSTLDDERITLLEKVDLATIEYFPNYSIPNLEILKVNTADKTNEEQLLGLDDLNKSVINPLEQTRLKIGGVVSGNIGLNSALNTSYGLKVQASLRPYLFLVASAERGQSSQAVGFDPFVGAMITEVHYPEPEANLVPQDGVLIDFGVNFKYTQFSLGLKKIWFPKEHIRPFIELGWAPYKENEGMVNYLYALESTIDPLLVFEVVDVAVPLNQENYTLGWGLNTIYGAAGLSASMLNDKVELNALIRCMNRLSSAQTLYHSEDKATIGVQLGLAFSFN